MLASANITQIPRQIAPYNPRSFHMLNRHLLRAKALQYLYALQNAKRSDLLLAEDYLDETFTPSFKDAEDITPALLEKKRKEAKILLHQITEGKEEVTGLSPDVINHARKAYREYVEACRLDTQKYFRFMMDETLAVYDRFLMVMSFLKQLGELCHEKSQVTGIVAEERKERLDYFYLSHTISCLRDSKRMNDLFVRNHIKWDEHPDFLEDFYKTHFRTSELTKTILGNGTAPDRETQNAWIEHVVKELFFMSPTTDSFFEDIDSNWQENKSIVKNMVYKTLKRIYEYEIGDADWIPVSITPDWEEDKIFFERIFLKTTQENDYLDKVLEKYLQNWDLERVTVIDTIILKMALTEMIHFPSIPVKVTINEFIELAKRYSTPKSKEFVNGILDRTSKDLKAEGVIKKSGRGLLDNG